MRLVHERYEVFRVGAILALAVAMCGPRPLLSQEHEVPRAEVLAGYSYLRSSSTNFNGWKATVVGNVNHWLGFAADFDGHYAGEEREHSVTLGPHVALRKSKRFTPIGYTLFGVAIERSASGESEHGLAVEMGGALDWEVNSRWALRVFDVAASVTHLGEETHVSPKFAVGVVLNLGHL